MKYFRRRRQQLQQKFLFGFLAVGLFLALPALTLAAPGDLDLTFGSGGIVITRDGNGYGFDVALGMAIQSDGKIVVVGEGATGNTWDFAVVRYNPNGSLDTSFGGTGIVITPIGNSHDSAQSVAIQSDGKIVVAGSIFNDTSGPSSLAIVRYNPNGSLDTSFGGTGKIITATSNGAQDLAIQADGKIVVAGLAVLIRYNTDGTLDTSFNGTGIVTAQGDGAGSVAIQSNGKIIAAGGSQNSFSIVRYNADGSLDTSFGGTGIVITPVGNYAGAAEVAIQTDGKIVVVGDSQIITSDFGTIDFAVVRYNPDGSLDTSFGGTGKIIIPISNSYDFASSVALQVDGKIVVAGTSKNNNNIGSDFAVVRLNPNGSLDTTFNGTGKITNAFGGQDFTSAVAIQVDGKIVVAGSTDNFLYDFYDFALVRYQGGSNANIRTHFDFDGDGKADISIFRPATGEWWYLRSTDGVNRAFQFGASTDKIVPADYTGDGKTDIAFWRPSSGEWFILRSEDNSFYAFPFGANGDIPLAFDFDGDGKVDPTVFRPSTQVWYTVKSTGGNLIRQFGSAGDLPVAADYDGDGKADLAIFRPGPSEWWIQKSSGGSLVYQFGEAGVKAVPADYTGDGKTDAAYYKPSTGEWFVIRSENQSYYGAPFGTAEDVPIPGDYDGDGKADFAVFRPSNNDWYLNRSKDGPLILSFGQTSDKPTANAFVP